MIQTKVPLDARQPRSGSPKRRSPSPRTLGPVADLERHLPPEWWRNVFNSVYLKTDGDVVENQSATRAEVDHLLDASGLTRDCRILDLCCGQGRHTLELARRGFLNTSGLDRSRYLVRLARKRAREEQLDIRFHEGDARQIGRRFKDLDAILVLGNSFGYFDREEDDLLVLTAIADSLRAGGRLVLDLTDGAWMRNHFEPRTWEWIDQQHLVCRERSLSSDERRLISREVVVNAEQGVIVDQFYAERLYDWPALETLLGRAGFLGITLSSHQEGISNRGVDLGMMAKRLLITAQSPSRVGAQRVAKPLSMVVVLGDPRQPDQVKRGGVFNEEDLDTVRRLKEALSELDGVDTQYLDRHDTLLHDLAASRPDLVLNLCDEGFGNDAFKELHVPAYLEMLEVPYTGAASAALAACYDKSLVRAIAQELGIAVPLETYLRAGDQAATLPSTFPAFVKPALGDSSVGITVDSVVHTPQQLVSTLAKARKLCPDRPFLIQEFLSGDEYSVGLLGNPESGLRALPILEVDYSQLNERLPRLLGYESKWQPDSAYWDQVRYVEAQLDEERAQLLVEWSRLLFERLGVRDYGRFDFRADDSGQIKLLEVNPNPGWCWDGKLNLMAEMEGTAYEELLSEIVTIARQRLGLAEVDH